MSRIVTIRNKKGLHARAAAKFVKTAANFQATVMVTRMVGGEVPELPDDPEWTVSASSILGLMMLGAEPGTRLQLVAEGADADAAMDALEQLVNNYFDEDE